MFLRLYITRGFLLTSGRILFNNNFLKPLGSVFIGLSSNIL